MARKIQKILYNWFLNPKRKPLVLRGARQVGKTYAVREFAGQQQLELLEFNFEKDLNQRHLFNSNDPHKILRGIEQKLNRSIVPERSLLFLDEIQAVPELLAKLRWFYENLPELPVIAAGSLLEFVLAKHQFSMPVGRISYAHLEPMSFEEFLDSCGEYKLIESLQEFQIESPFNKVIHERLLEEFNNYVLVGGMPAATSAWADTHSFVSANEIQHELFITYRDDFAKYSGRLDQQILVDTITAVPKMLGQKFKYSNVPSSANIAAIKQAIQLLCLARVCHAITSCAANGLPFAAEKNAKFFKIILLDVGLVSAAQGLSLINIEQKKDLNLVNMGAISEQVVGQLLRTLNPHYIEPELYYWLRETSKSNAEIDYVFAHQGQVIPIEVKSGTSGSLKSLHYFMANKKLPRAIRINSDHASKTQVKTLVSDGEKVEYELLSIPFYLIEQLPRLLSQ